MERKLKQSSGRCAVGASPRCAGRRPDAAKSEDILRVARGILLEVGFSGMTIEAVAHAAGVSKVTVYRRYRTKEALFGAVVQACCAEARAVFVGESRTGVSPRDSLIEIGELLMGHIMSKEVIALDRILASEATRQPALARDFFRSGPECILGQLTSVLKRERGALGLPPRVADECAEMLLSLWFGFEWEAVRLGVRKPPNLQWIRRHAVRCVDLVLRGYGVRTLS